MALQKSIVTKEGFECPESYHRITILHFYKHHPVQAEIAIYKDAEAAHSGKASFDVFQFQFEWEPSADSSIISDAYNYLKTLDAYRDVAVDV